MRTPVVAELPSKRIQRRRRDSRATRAQESAQYVAYRRRNATSTMRVATALTRWVGR
jgi:hypothetical protein